MGWAEMLFRGQRVWARVDVQGRLVLDRDGRAEMKYRVEDARSYRPSPGNLEPPGNEGAGVLATPDQPPAVSERGARPGGPPGSGKITARTIHVWTDGACTGNPGPMGIGVVVTTDAQRRELSEYLGIGTNNIAELTAIERGLDLAEELAPDRERGVRVYTDSAYAIGVISLGWKAKANQELVGRLRRRRTGFAHLTFVKVAGHAGIPENERCDQLARRAIETHAGT
jgi:ribonuclease HI